jgi:hypothetical protein
MAHYRAQRNRQPVGGVVERAGALNITCQTRSHRSVHTTAVVGRHRQIDEMKAAIAGKMPIRNENGPEDRK